jgi:hypothetical protein
MKKILTSLLAGILIGGAGVFAWTWIRAGEQADRDFSDDLRRDAELSRLRAELASERSTAGALRKQIETAALDTTPVKEDELDIERLLNDARPLMKSLALMFAGQRKTMTERWIRSTAEKLAEEMGLTEEQTDEMIAHFLKLDEENFAKIKAMLDRPLTILDVFTTMKDMNPQKSMDDYVMAKLTDDQKKAWEGRKLETKAQQVERSANRQLERMSRLNLDEEQKDRVFDILVKKNPQYDSSMAVEGVTTGGAEMDAKKSQDEAIAEVLRPEQMEQWTQMQERRNNERQRWTDALGGFDPGQFFQGMEDGMGWRGRGRRGR